MNLSVFNIKGEDTGKKVKLSDAIYKIEPNDHAIYLDVKQYMANQRHGTHKAKERGEIKGSTKKVKRQKGTGTARMGTLKSPILRGGGRAFGPQPRDYGFKLNKKVKKLARKSALSYKASDKELMIIEDFKLDAPKTKTYIEILKNLSVEGAKTLLIVPETDKNIYLSSHNLQKAKVSTADMLNTYDVLNSDKLLVCEGSLKIIEKILN